MADWNALKSRLNAELGDNHQRLALGLIHLSQVQESLVGLNSLGYHFDLVEIEPPKPVEFPKMLYKDGPQGLVDILAYSAQDEEKLFKDGWRLTPLAAVKKAEVAKLAEPAKPGAP